MKRAADRSAALFDVGSPILEVGGESNEDKATQSVVDLRERVPVAEGRRAVGAGQWRILVEHVVHTNPEVQIVVDRKVRRQIDVVLRSQRTFVGDLVSRVV